MNRTAFFCHCGNLMSLPAATERDMNGQEIGYIVRLNCLRCMAHVDHYISVAVPVSPPTETEQP